MHRDSENIVKYQGGLEFHRLGAVGVRCAGVQRWQVDTDMSAGREEKAADRVRLRMVCTTALMNTGAHAHVALFERPWAKPRSPPDKVLFSAKSNSKELTCPWRLEGNQGTKRKTLEAVVGTERSQAEVLLSRVLGQTSARVSPMGLGSLSKCCLPGPWRWASCPVCLSTDAGTLGRLQTTGEHAKSTMGRTASWGALSHSHPAASEALRRLVYEGESRRGYALGLECITPGVLTHLGNWDLHPAPTFSCRAHRGSASQLVTTCLSFSSPHTTSPVSQPEASSGTSLDHRAKCGFITTQPRDPDGQLKPKCSQ